MLSRSLLFPSLKQQQQPKDVEATQRDGAFPNGFIKVPAHFLIFERLNGKFPITPTTLKLMTIQRNIYLKKKEATAAAAVLSLCCLQLMVGGWYAQLWRYLIESLSRPEIGGS